MSCTLRGTLSVAPFLPSSDFFEGSVFFATDFAFSAVFLEAVAAFFEVDFAADFAFAAVDFAALVAFFAVALVADLAFVAVFFVAAFALLAVDFVAFLVFSTALAAAPTFLATAALRPASWSFFAPAPATLLTESNLAATSFFAVAAPTPGSAVNTSIFEEPFLAAMVSLALP
mgnify:FL=1